MQVDPNSLLGLLGFYNYYNIDASLALIIIHEPDNRGNLSLSAARAVPEPVRVHDCTLMSQSSH